MSFGHPDAIGTANFENLPPQMQAEGVLLLMEGGLGEAEIKRRTGLPLHRIATLVKLAGAPFSLASQWFEQIGSAE